MDSLTHVLAGACLGAALVPAARRRTAMVVGAVLQTLPDADNLWLAFADPVTRFVGHRGQTHSLLVLPFVALACWLLLRRFVPAAREAPGRWLALCFAALLLHPLLDAMTVYGTRLFWPLERPPVMHANLFIIDPAFTLPLLVAAVAAWIGRDALKVQRWAVMGLALAAAYTGWTLIAKSHLDATVRAHYAAKGATELEVLTVPTPFNSIVWRVVVREGEHYGEGYYSFLGDGKLVIDIYPGPRTLPEPVASSPAVRALDAFTRGWYRIDRDRDRYVFVDLRMGAEPDYIFRFAVGSEQDGKPVALEPPEQYPWPKRTRAQLARVWDRMFAAGGAEAAPAG